MGTKRQPARDESACFKARPRPANDKSSGPASSSGATLWISVSPSPSNADSSQAANSLTRTTKCTPFEGNNKISVPLGRSVGRLSYGSEDNSKLDYECVPGTSILKKLFQRHREKQCTRETPAPSPSLFDISSPKSPSTPPPPK